MCRTRVLTIGFADFEFALSLVLRNSDCPLAAIEVSRWLRDAMADHAIGLPFLTKFLKRPIISLGTATQNRYHFQLYSLRGLGESPETDGAFRQLLQF
jgi:hypothetical protein